MSLFRNLILCTAILTTPIAAEDVYRYTGVNLSGAEFGGTGGTYGTHYIYPTVSDSYLYFRAKGMNTFRLPFRWERLQPTLGGAFDAAEWTRLQNCVTTLTATGATVLLDVHNYARYRGRIIANTDGPTNAQFSDLWRRLATRWKNDPQVIFGLMNEPFGLAATQWAQSANHAIAAIRATGAKNLVFVPGVSWSGAHSWNSSGNAVAMLAITDSQNNYAFEVHQYVDNDSSGTNLTQVANNNDNIGATRLAGFTQWCRTHGKRGFLGEFATPKDALGRATADKMLAHMANNRDVWMGWTWWSAGPWWGSTYDFSIQPTSTGGDKPQMAIIVKHLAPSTPPPANVAPIVSAGPDRTVTITASATLDGTVADDGRPTSTVTTTWSKLSGPGTVTFGNHRAVDTTARFSAAGTYVLRLSASDGALTTTDSMTVTVTAATAATLQMTTITLRGTVAAGTTALTIDGVSAAIDTRGGFSLTLTVPAGSSVHQMTVTDGHGRETEYTITLASGSGAPG